MRCTQAKTEFGSDFPRSLKNGILNMKRMLWVALVAASVSQVGCGNKDADTTASASSGAAANAGGVGSNVDGSNPLAGSPVSTAGSPNGVAAQETMVPMNSLNLTNPTKPEEVVAAFLDGMRTGNAAVIESLLSTRARQEIKAKGLDIAPIGSPKAQFEIGKAEFADPKDPNTMLVSSNWLEPGSNGQPIGEYEVVWALVKEPNGWRICEMAVDTHQEGEEVQVVNFENLADIAPDPASARTAALPAGATPPPSAPAYAPALPAGVPNLPAGSAPAFNAPAINPAAPPAFNPPAVNAPSAGGFAPPNPGLPAPAGGLPPAPGAGLPSAPGALPPLPPGNFNLPAAGAPSLRQN
jgi:hypothetical protein